ncbi:hypothetical protein DKG34_34960 [Streptomyces sp. NWU49]|nr:hypothetical protein DKG34_34960 [Streptomyces sp. NWU49]
MDELVPFFRREAERFRRERGVRRVPQRLQMGLHQVQGRPAGRCKHPATLGHRRQAAPPLGRGVGGWLRQSVTADALARLGQRMRRRCCALPARLCRIGRCLQKS